MDEVGLLGRVDHEGVVLEPEFLAPLDLEPAGDLDREVGPRRVLVIVSLDENGILAEVERDVPPFAVRVDVEILLDEDVHILLENGPLERGARGSANLQRAGSLLRPVLYGIEFRKSRLAPELLDANVVDQRAAYVKIDVTHLSRIVRFLIDDHLHGFGVQQLHDVAKKGDSLRVSRDGAAELQKLFRGSAPRKRQNDKNGCENDAFFHGLSPSLDS